VLPVLLALASPVADAATLEITVTDPRVTALVLECADGTHKLVVDGGRAVLEKRPKDCVVNQVVRSGSITAPGAWTCGLEGCTQQDVAHRDVSDADGRINVIVASDLPKGSWLELTCPQGFRERASVEENTATFDAVPEEECTLWFKGGVPAKFTRMRWGTWQCLLSGTTAVCTER
jgi:hypothetical protein